MMIVLVHWQIKPECEQEFLLYWKTKAIITDRTGLIGEFLSKVEPRDPVRTPWITWLLAEPVEDAAAHHINVGLWSCDADFLEQISGDFGDDRPIQPFELRRRRRVMLEPEAWRIGAALAPRSDSKGVT